MGAKRFKLLGMWTFLGDFAYQRVVEPDHFLRQWASLIDWEESSTRGGIVMSRGKRWSRRSISTAWVAVGMWAISAWSSKPTQRPSL